MIKGGKAESLFRSKLIELLDNSNTILDIGTSQRYAKELKRYEDLFKEKEYRAAGYKPSKSFGIYNCDLDLDICNINLPDDSYDAIICIEVLEHVADPFNAAKEIRRVLKPGGRLLLTTPFMFGYHGKTRKLNNYSSHAHDAYPDFWRFTHEGLHLLFKEFNKIEIIPIDGPLETGFKVFGLSRILERSKLFRKFTDTFDRPKMGSQTSRHLLFAEK